MWSSEQQTDILSKMQKKNEEYSTGGLWGGWEKGENSFKRRYYKLFWNTYIKILVGGGEASKEGEEWLVDWQLSMNGHKPFLVRLGCHSPLP